MHFLCLHGIGTNGQIFETQTATVRYELDQHHTFDFAEGNIHHEIADEIRNFYPSHDSYFSYYETKPDSIKQALTQLDKYIAAEGPFDGVLAFSQGACLASTYLLKLCQERPAEPLPFRCAIFFSSPIPIDPEALRADVLRYATKKLSGISTAHIWGRVDKQYATESEILWNLCSETAREWYIHSGGHEIPSARAKEDVQGCVRAIRRAIDKASIEC